MMEAGMDAARFHFSHQNHEFHGGLIDNVIAAREELDRIIPLILDTKSPEIRTNLLIQKKFTLSRIWN